MWQVILRAAIPVWVLIAAAGAQAQVQTPTEFPSRSVRLVIPFPPGAATDILGRLLGQKLGEKWGQSVVIDNKPGAGSILGAETVARAPADGYTLFMGHIGTHGANPALYARLPYDPVKDFAPVSLLVSIPNLLAVHPSVGASSVQELISLSKAKPGSIRVATPGVSTSAHLILALFKSITGADLTHVPYKGAVASSQAAVAGDVEATFDTVTSIMPQARVGKLRVLAVSSRERAPLAPDAPPLAEAGVPGFDVSTWFALFAPSGTARPVIDRISSETVSVLRSKDMLERLQVMGMSPVGSSPEELGAHVNREIERWGKVVREAGIRIE